MYVIARKYFNLPYISIVFLVCRTAPSNPFHGRRDSSEYGGPQERRWAETEKGDQRSISQNQIINGFPTK